MASAEDKPNSPLRTGKDAPNSSYNAKAEMALIGTLLERDFTTINFDGRTFYVFYMGVERGKRRAVILHPEEYLGSSDFVRKYPEMVRSILPTDGETKIHIVPQKTIDYLLKERAEKHQK